MAAPLALKSLTNHEIQTGQTIDEFAKKLNEQGVIGLLNEYSALNSSDSEFPATSSDQHRHLNRWQDIKCFDHSRVSLSPRQDYIHANYVDGLTQARKFICTQAPLVSTKADFWRMVWQEGTVVIIALTKVGGAKCELYLPHKTSTATTYGSIKVRNKRILNVADTFDMTTLTISQQKQKRTVRHFLYHAWPDKGIPDSSINFLNFLDVMNKSWKELTERAIAAHQWSNVHQGPPIVVHCSAGVGRTGTLVALDICIERLYRTLNPPAALPLVEIQQTVKTMRQQRHKAVQRPEQYIFIFLAVLEFALRNRMIDKCKVNVDSFLMGHAKGVQQPPPEQKQRTK